jgi:hypothetical protein
VDKFRSQFNRSPAGWVSLRENPPANPIARLNHGDRQSNLAKSCGYSEARSACANDHYGFVVDHDGSGIHPSHGSYSSATFGDRPLLAFKISILLFLEPSHLFYELQKGQWQSLVCGSSLYRLCLLCLIEECRAFCAAWRCRRSFQRIYHICARSLFSLASLPSGTSHNVR